MSDGQRQDLPPAPPLQPPPVAVVEPWQARLEVVAVLLLVSVALTLLARLAGAYDQARAARAFDDSIDLVAVVRLAGEQTGLIAAGGVLVAFLLVTLGPDGRLSGRGLLALRGVTVIGLAVAGVCAFAGLASLASSDGASPFNRPGASVARTAVDRLSIGVPLLLAAAIAGYVAWCAFSALGELPDLDDDATRPPF
ncbi:hypothetical protein ACE2AJ_02575 [Aquihabitans daechungensis]|uniref:hypothetical protein n=1 Tax=Aquihabitans daechungensis TaxID=1052257 RepID=UPI003B9FA3C9